MPLAPILGTGRNAAAADESCSSSDTRSFGGSRRRPGSAELSFKASFSVARASRLSARWPVGRDGPGVPRRPGRFVRRLPNAKHECEHDECCEQTDKGPKPERCRSSTSLAARFQKLHSRAISHTCCDTLVADKQAMTTCLRPCLECGRPTAGSRRAGSRSPRLSARWRSVGKARVPQRPGLPRSRGADEDEAHVLCSLLA